MRVLSANSSEMPSLLGEDFPDRVGSLWTPKSLKKCPEDYYYVLDNGRYSGSGGREVGRR